MDFFTAKNLTKGKIYMSVYFNLASTHQIALANPHFYESPTQPLYLDRTLQYHDFIYLCEGGWMITESDVDYRLHADDVLLLSAGHHHYTRFPCEPRTRTMCIHVSCEPGDLTPSESALELPIHMNVKGHPRVWKYFNQIVSIYWNHETHKSARMSTLFNQLVLELADISEKGDGYEHELVVAAIKMINNAPHMRFNAADVAKELSVSLKKLDSAMLKSTGLTFSKYQTMRKLEMAAAQIVVEPDIRLSEIASLFGFYDEFHLSRLFKQKYGVSPQQYRKNALEKSPNP